MIAAATLSSTYPRAYDPTLDLDSLQQKEKLSSKNIAALTCNHSVYFSNKPGDLPIVIDTGASLSLTPIWDDFIGDLEETPLSKLNGLSSKTEVIGIGTVEFTIRDLFGVVRTIHTRAYYVPKATIRLFSPQSYFQEQDAGSCMVTSKCMVLTLADGTSLEFPYNNGSNLPLMLPDHQVHIGATRIDRNFLRSAECLSTFLSVTHKTNQNINASQKELLLWHWKLGHAKDKKNQSCPQNSQQYPPAKLHFAQPVKWQSRIVVVLASPSSPIKRWRYEKGTYSWEKWFQLISIYPRSLAAFQILAVKNQRKKSSLVVLYLWITHLATFTYETNNPYVLVIL